MLITSRPEILIRLRFRAISESVYKDFVLHEIPAAIIRYNITIFLKHELDKIKEDFLLLFN